MSSISDETYHLGEFEPRPDDDVVICRCEEITRGEIRRAVHAGMYTMNEVKRFLRAGWGCARDRAATRPFGPSLHRNWAFLPLKRM